MRVLGPLERAEVLALGREDPEAAGPGDVEVAALLDLDPVDRVLARGARHVEEHAAVRQAPAGLDPTCSGVKSGRATIAVRPFLMSLKLPGSPNEEMAEILGESVSSVKSRLHRARMALREVLTRRLGHRLS